MAADCNNVVNELLYTLNFSQAFNTTANFSEIMRTDLIKKSPALTPNYFDGAMLANDFEFFLYGGLLQYTDSAPHGGEEVYGYQLKPYGPEKLFQPDNARVELPKGMTRYVTYGGAANSPSENKAWYFGGAGSPTGGPIYFQMFPETDPTNASNFLITLDMTTQGSEKWSNDSLPPNIKSRNNAELVWVPVGEQGILVALGGVLFPINVNSYPQESTIKEQSVSPASARATPGY